MAKQVHIHIHRSKARDAGEGEGKGKWITLSPSGTHVKVDGKGEITAGPKGLTGKKPSELSKKSASAPGKHNEPSTQQVAKHVGKKVQPSKPGWALRADPELAAKFEAAEKRSQAKKLERETGAPSTGKPAKKVNIGSEKWPLMAKQESGGKIGGFEPPARNADGMGNGKGDFMIAIGNEGYSFSREKTSFVTGKPVYEYSGPEGARVWVHPDGQVDLDDSIPRGSSKAAPSTGKASKPPTVSMASLKEGQALYDKSGQKVDEVESIQKRSLGKGLTINTRAGYQVHVDENGTNSQGWSNEKPGASGASPTAQNQKGEARTLSGVNAYDPPKSTSTKINAANVTYRSGGSGSGTPPTDKNQHGTWLFDSAVSSLADHSKSGATFAISGTYAEAEQKAKQQAAAWGHSQLRLAP